MFSLLGYVEEFLSYLLSVYRNLVRVRVRARARARVRVKGVGAVTYR